MTSEQVMLSLAALLVCITGGCAWHKSAAAPPLVSPYALPHVWAVAPLNNESGSLEVDSARVADHLAQQLQNAQGLSVLPVNRVLAAMEALKLPAIRSAEDAQRVRALLGADGLIVGTITAYDPYDPPKLGLSLALYEKPAGASDRIDLDELRTAPSDIDARLRQPDAMRPTCEVSGYFDAADPAVRTWLKRYAGDRGPQSQKNNPAQGNWQIYRLSMDLYTEFVSYLVCSRLLEAEQHRLSPTPPPGAPATQRQVNTAHAP